MSFWQRLGGMLRGAHFYEGEPVDGALVAAVLQRQPEFAGMRDERLPRYADWLQSRVGRGEALERLLPDAFGAMREVLRRQGDDGVGEARLRGAIWATRGKLVVRAAGDWDVGMLALAAFLRVLEGPGLMLVAADEERATALQARISPMLAKLGREVGLVRASDAREARRQIYGQPLACVALDQFCGDLLRDRLNGPALIPMPAAVLIVDGRALWEGRWLGLADGTGKAVATADRVELLGACRFVGGFLAGGCAQASAAAYGLALAPLDEAARAACRRAKPEGERGEVPVRVVGTIEAQPVSQTGPRD